MIRASALYLVIVIALFIAVLCSALISAAYFYRARAQFAARYQILRTNAASGVNLLLAGADTTFRAGKVVDLFENATDSVYLKKIAWGVFDIGISKSFIQQDSVYRIFSIANVLDSAKWSALYLIDEDRPLSVSGKTAIVGDAYLPKAGVKPAYVESHGYEGNEKIVSGRTLVSGKTLPPLDEQRLTKINETFDRLLAGKPSGWKDDSLSRSFFLAPVVINLGKATTLDNVKLNGNVIIVADTSLSIGSTDHLENVQIFAQSIIVKSGFEGNCQLFARDSIVIQPGSIMRYPSAAGILRFKAPIVKSIENLKIAGSFYGEAFTYEKAPDRNSLPIIELGSGTTFNGYLYASGRLSLKDGVTIKGGLAASRFLYQSTSTRYENYLINAKVDETALSRYFLTAALMPVAGSKKEILQWLERN